MNTIKINGQDYKVKYTIRALFMYERLYGKTFEMNSTEDSFHFFFAMIKANNPEATITWDEFLDAIDEDSTIAIAFTNILNAQTQQKIEMGEPDDGKPSKKK